MCSIQDIFGSNSQPKSQPCLPDAAETPRLQQNTSNPVLNITAAPVASGGASSNHQEPMQKRLRILDRHPSTEGMSAIDGTEAFAMSCKADCKEGRLISSDPMDAKTAYFKARMVLGHIKNNKDEVGEELKGRQRMFFRPPWLKASDRLKQNYCVCLP